MQNQRGFESFMGKTIASINTKAINMVEITFTDGSVHEIWAEDKHYGIEVISAIQTN